MIIWYYIAIMMQGGFGMIDQPVPVRSMTKEEKAAFKAQNRRAYRMPGLFLLFLSGLLCAVGLIIYGIPSIIVSLLMFLGVDFLGKNKGELVTGVCPACGETLGMNVTKDEKTVCPQCKKTVYYSIESKTYHVDD